MAPLANAAGLLETVTPQDEATKRWLTTRVNVKAALLILDTSRDTLIDTLISRASALIADACGLAADAQGGVASFAREDLRATWFPSCWNRGPVLALPWRLPVSEIISVLVDGEARSPGEYRLLAAKPGRLQFLSDGLPACWSWAKIVVTFKAGWDLPANVPADLELAAIEQVRAMVHAASRDPAVRSASVADVGSASYALPGGDTFGGVLLPQVVDILSIGGYRNPMP